MREYMVLIYLVVAKINVLSTDFKYSSIVHRLETERRRIVLWFLAPVRVLWSSNERQISKNMLNLSRYIQ